MRTNVVLNMVLIDTSVLINYLKNVEDQYTNALNTLIENHYPLALMILSTWKFYMEQNPKKNMKSLKNI